MAAAFCYQSAHQEGDMGLFSSVICRFGAGELIEANPDCSLSQINITRTHTVVDGRCLYRFCWSHTLYSLNWTIGSAKKWSSYGLTFLWGAIANDLITLIVLESWVLCTLSTNSNHKRCPCTEWKTQSSVAQREKFHHEKKSSLTIHHFSHPEFHA